MVISLPALAAGGWLLAPLIITFISSKPVAPVLSFAVRRKVYVPCSKSIAIVTALSGYVISPAVGPATLVHLYPAMLPSTSEAEPKSMALLSGKVMVISAPAFTTG